MTVRFEVSEIGYGQTDFISKVVRQIRVNEDADGVLDNGLNCIFNHSILVVCIGHKKL